jgi:2,4'-dihydroxyacetophenone dioxygenase
MEIFEDLFGVIEPDEAILREFEVHLRDFWHSRIDLLSR